MKSIERIRWRARRGMLELDILLEKFIGGYYTHLDKGDMRVFEELLDMPDNELWDMIAGKQETMNPEHRALLEKIRAA